MNLKQMLRKAYAAFGRTLSLTDPDGWAHPSWGGGGTYAGKTVTEISAMQMSAVFGCVRILAESIGALPWSIYEKDKQGNAKKVDHPLSGVLIDSPNADMTDVEFREAGVVNLALQGNAYSLKETNGAGNIASLYPIPAGNVEKKRKDDGAIQFRVCDRGKWETYPQEKIWHVPGFGSNGLTGFSPIGYQRQAIGLGLATEEFGARFFGQGATTSGVVNVPDWLKDEQRLKAREILQQKYEGLGNAHKLMLLEGGMQFTSVSMPLEDAQFLETRRFQVNEIARIYRVPPHMLADLERATFSNIEHMSIEFVVFTLQPYLTRFERSVSKWLLKPGERGRFFLRFNLEGLLRGDSDARAKFYAAMLQNGVYNRNEVRALENMNQVAGQGMDEYTVQSNMAPIDALAALLAGKQPAAAAPAPAKDADVQNINIHLPAGMKHEIAQRIDVPGIIDLANAVRRSNELATAAAEKVASGIEELKDLATRDRELTYDEAGEPNGTRLVH